MSFVNKNKLDLIQVAQQGVKDAKTVRRESSRQTRRRCERILRKQIKQLKKQGF